MSAGDGTPSPEIGFDDFLKVDIRTGIIVDAQPFPEARKPAIKLWVDFGEPLGVRKSSAQITVHYTPEDLIGKQVMAVTNFPPRQIGKFMSEILVLGFPDENGEVVLAAPDKLVPKGGRLF
ncbi:MAG: tRNA-binding protein [Tepidamorphaceae bacterium]|nr:tRNA-binding protein [Rhodobiaceae bacterium]MCC0049621.1 tRNA-binding protein [Rhodobiaceae bacterium]